MKNIKIVEGVEGRWNYHLSLSGLNGQPTLCNKKNVMSTNLPLSAWGAITHLHESYCKECEIIHKTGEMKEKEWQSANDSLIEKRCKFCNRPYHISSLKVFHIDKHFEHEMGPGHVDICLDCYTKTGTELISPCECDID